jgi:hypothetical protein
MVCRRDEFSFCSEEGECECTQTLQKKTQVSFPALSTLRCCNTVLCDGILQSVLQVMAKDVNNAVRSF